MKLSISRLRPVQSSSSVHSARLGIIGADQLLTVMPGAASSILSVAQAPAEKKPTSGDELRAGKNYISTQVYSQQDDQKLLTLFDGLRVADVSDGMDAVGLQNTGLMNSDIRPLWKDTVKFTHRFIGIAVTARYVPTQHPPAGLMKTADYDKWVGD